jgi:hypothetical protein
MAKLGIFTGTYANDGTGDTLLDAVIKIKLNFDDIYSTFGDGTNLYSSSGISTYASIAGFTTYAQVAGIVTNSSTSNYATIAGYSTSSGISTISQGLTGSPNIVVNNLYVSGVSTFSGIATVTGVSLFTKQLSVSGVSTFAGITTTTGTTFTNQLSVSGVTTVGRYQIKTGIGTFTALIGGTHTIDTFDITTDNFKTVEYTLHVQNGTDVQSNKILVMQDGTNAYSQQYATMFNNVSVVSVATTITSNICYINLLPSSGISGLTTYTFTREAMV